MIHRNGRNETEAAFLSIRALPPPTKSAKKNGEIEKGADDGGRERETLGKEESVFQSSHESERKTRATNAAEIWSRRSSFAAEWRLRREAA